MKMLYYVEKVLILLPIVVGGDMIPLVFSKCCTYLGICFRFINSTILLIFILIVFLFHLQDYLPTTT